MLLWSILAGAAVDLAGPLLIQPLPLLLLPPLGILDSFFELNNHGLKFVVTSVFLYFSHELLKVSQTDPVFSSSSSLNVFEISSISHAH